MKFLLQKPTIKPITNIKHSNAIIKFKPNQKISLNNTNLHSTSKPDDYKEDMKKAMEKPEVK